MIMGALAVFMRVLMGMMMVVDVGVSMFVLVGVRHAVVRVFMSMLMRVLMVVGVVVFVLAFHSSSPRESLTEKLDAYFAANDST